jgi:hypothetical protein
MNRLADQLESCTKTHKSRIARRDTVALCLTTKFEVEGRVQDASRDCADSHWSGMFRERNAGFGTAYIAA